MWAPKTNLTGNLSDGLSVLCNMTIGLAEPTSSLDGCLATSKVPDPSFHCLVGSQPTTLPAYPFLAK